MVQLRAMRQVAPARAFAWWSALADALLSLDRRAEAREAAVQARSHAGSPEERDHAAQQLPNFEYAEALFQIAVVLGSVAIVAASPALLGVSGCISLLALLLTVNGFFLVYHLPHG